jgi:hypothetical protein
MAVSDASEITTAEIREKRNIAIGSEEIRFDRAYLETGSECIVVHGSFAATARKPFDQSRAR